MPLMDKKFHFEEIRKKLFQNSALMSLSRICVIIASVLCVPFIVEFVGWDGYGVWETLLAFAGISTIIIGPLNSTILWRISNVSQTQGNDYSYRLLRIGIFLSLAAFLIFVPPAWIFRLEIVKLLKIPPQYCEIASWLARRFSP